MLNFNIVVILRHGLMIAIQEEIHWPKPMVELESTLLPLVLVSNVKDLLREEDRASPNIVEIPKLGSMTAIQEEIHWLKPTVELESTLQHL